MEEELLSNLGNVILDINSNLRSVLNMYIDEPRELMSLIEKLFIKLAENHMLNIP